MFIRSAPLQLCRPTWRHITWATTLMLLGAASAAPPAGADSATADTAVLAVVEVPKPGYVPRFMVTRKMRETIPQYTSIPGLAFKAYAINRDGSAYGGLYLWDSLGEARAWFSPDWFERVRRERGVDATVRMFQVISVVDTVPDGTPPDPAAMPWHRSCCCQPTVFLPMFPRKRLQASSPPTNTQRACFDAIGFWTKRDEWVS